MALADFRHRLPLRVRWAEVDMQAVVFNGHYLTYCDVCLTEYWRAIGLSYPQAFEELGIDTFVRKASLEYHAAARYDDELLACGRTCYLGTSSLRFAVALYRVHGDSAHLLDAELVYVCVDATTRRPQPWPDAVRERIAGFELLAPDAPHVG